MVRVRTTNYVRIALVLSLEVDTPPEDLIRTIDSIRTQKLIPWFVRIVYESPLSYDYEEAAQSLEYLRYFCPNVGSLMANGVDLSHVGYRHLMLYGADVDVYVTLPAGLVLKPMAMYDLTQAFYDPEVNKAFGKADHLEQDHPRFARFVDKFFPKHSKAKLLVAHRRSEIEKEVW